ncbi:serum response factor homolog [Anthonomus grandis grandis]|uniref:serum response factor homolog n=1 Tax=Anthonomus grandis grandis TaxID=2921223 RepID=UPI002165B60A|nr:serum response factor homolog [Anthonomus grandis grandis]
MEPPGGRDSRFQLGYSMNLLSGETSPEIYGGGGGLGGRPSTSLQQLSPRHTMVSAGGGCGPRGPSALKGSDVCYDAPQGHMGFEPSPGGVNDIHDETYSTMQSKKSPPSNGKKTKGRVKIKMEYIENKLRRYTTFSKRKTGIMKKAYELSTLTGTQVMLLVASETGHVYTFATRKLQPMITSEAGKALIQTCLNSPDPPAGSSGGDQRMSATGFEETELTYNISDEDSKENTCNSSDAEDYDDDISEEEEEPPNKKIFVSAEKLSPTPPFATTTSQDSLDSSSSSEMKKQPEEPTTPENATIINQINQIKDALIQSNKAKAASSHTTMLPSTSSSNVPSLITSTQPPPQIQLIPSSLTPDNNMKVVPLIAPTPNGGFGFVSVAEGLILGTIQNSPTPKYVAIPLSSVIPGGVEAGAVKAESTR